MITSLIVIDQNGRSYSWITRDNSPAYGFDDFMSVTSESLTNTKYAEVRVNDIAEYEQICRLCDEKNQDIIAVIYDPTII